MSKNRDSVVTHKKCPQYVADYRQRLDPKRDHPPCRVCGQDKKKH